MHDPDLRFSYTRGLPSYLGSVSPFLLLVLLEGGLFLVLILSFTRGGARWGLALGLVTLLSVPVFGVLLAPLWTRHRLGPDRLELRYGRDRLAIPFAWIAEADGVEEKLAHTRVAIAYDPRRERAVACFSPMGQVRLVLDRPRTLEGRWRRRQTAVREVLLNVDRREDFLALLAPHLGKSADCEVAQPPLHAVRPAPTEEAPAVRRATAPPPLAVGGWAIETRGLSRRYGSRLAVDALDLRVAPGEIYGFLGPNGAGKTTTIKMLVGLLEPTSGSVFFEGVDAAREPLRAKRAFGYVPDRAHLYERLTGREFLELLAQVRRLPRREAEGRIAELTSLLQLDEAADSLSGTYSFGMKRKLALAAALLHRPRILILDEPFNGLDPRSARRFKDLLLRLAGEGYSILMSTHDLTTAETVCHRLGVLHRGRRVAEGRSAAELRAVPGAEGAADLEAVFLQLTEEGPAGVERTEGSAA